MAQWLMKTEPEDYSWDRLVADGETEWNGVRNHQAAANMRAMRKGDRVFFYRSVVEPAIVGIMTVSEEAYPASAEPGEKFVCVKVKPLRPLPREVSLAAIKADPRLADLKLVRQSRLSVMPVSDEHWRLLCGMAGLRE
jgi:predicted RNA-binding protein with PUA-like domain